VVVNRLPTRDSPFAGAPHHICEVLTPQQTPHQKERPEVHLVGYSFWSPSTTSRRMLYICLHAPLASPSRCGATLHLFAAGGGAARLDLHGTVFLRKNEHNIHRHGVPFPPFGKIMLSEIMNRTRPHAGLSAVVCSGEIHRKTGAEIGAESERGGAS
jgi:hypothetical protein